MQGCQSHLKYFPHTFGCKIMSQAIRKKQENPPCTVGGISKYVTALGPESGGGGLWGTKVIVGTPVLLVPKAGFRLAYTAYYIASHTPHDNRLPSEFQISMSTLLWLYQGAA